MRISKYVIRYKSAATFVLLSESVLLLLVGLLPRAFGVSLRTSASSRAASSNRGITQFAQADLNHANLVHVNPVKTAGAPQFNARTLTTRYSGPAELSAILAANQAEPLSLASTDLDSDGVQDLVCGYGTSSHGIITVQRGNIDSIYPNTAQAKARLASGAHVDSPFLPEAAVTALPLRPDFLAAGDFDGDGHSDLVAAERGATRLCFALGGGHGYFTAIKEVKLPGAITAFAAGDVNRPDGFVDVVAGVTSDKGSKLLVFSGIEGAMRSVPEEIDLPAPASSIAIGHFYGTQFGDIAVSAGNRVLIVQGRNARLYERKIRDVQVASPFIRTVANGISASALAAGRFGGSSETDLAILSSTGKMYLLHTRAGKGTGRFVVSRWRPADLTTAPSAELPVGLHAAWLPGSSTQSLCIVDPVSRSVVMHSFSGLAAASSDSNLLKFEPALSLSASDIPAAILPMRLNAGAASGFVILTENHSAPSIVVNTATSTFTVSNTNDSGTGSLRQAILDANSTLGIDAILFNISGSAPHSIDLASPLPPITEGVTIDATSNPDFTTAPVIEINGLGAGPSASGLTLQASGCVIRGLVIDTFSSDDNPLVDPLNNAAIALLPDAKGAAINNNTIEGNYIGIDPTGALPRENTGVGILLNSASNTIVGGPTSPALNVISGNGLSGIYFTTGSGGPPTANQILGNNIGTDATGTVAIPNGTSANALGGHSGIYLNTGPGSAETIQGNLISGNTADGITSTDQAGLGAVTVANNQIGTDVSGEVALHNGGFGINAGAQVFTIQDNLISANGSAGIVVTNNAGTAITGNTIGADKNISRPMGNGAQGILVLNSQITAMNNVIGGNGSTGIEVTGIFSDNCGIQGNHIGTNTAATLALANGNNGVFIHDGPQSAQITGNVIVGNGGSGIRIPNSLVNQQALFNKISQNQIASNSSLGIDLGPQGVTENPFNQLTGANNLQNFPVLTSAAISGTQLTVSGSLQASPLTAYTIEFFLGQSCGQLGHQNLNGLPVFLGSATVTTDGTGNASVAFSVALPSTGTGAFVNATATDPKGNTSEFCECIQATQQCPFTLTPSSQLFGPAGGLGSVALSGSSTCSWTAVSQAPWLTVQSGSSGSGPGTVTYLAAPNQGSSARTGSLVIAGIPFTVTEQVTGPTISGARVSGQNLIVSGQGFDQGSVILLNSQAGKTRFRNSGVLVGKKLANQVQIGQTVTVQVVTSTNVLSPAFSFTRAS